MKRDLRDYQTQAVEDATQFLQTAQRGDKRLYVAPCGTGKSVIEVAVQEALSSSVIITPRQEIVDGMVAKGGDRGRIYTPITYRNRLLEGRAAPADYLIIDEAHHDTNDTANTIRLCVGDAPTVAYTATPYRGTPQGTAALRALYGEPHYILRLADAVARGLCTLPSCRTEPILDDDIVEIQSGDFRITTVHRKTPWRAAADLVCSMWSTRTPTVVSLPSVQSVGILGEALAGRVPTVSVVGATPSHERVTAFARCVAADAVLLQVQVVSEGVDLPIRRLIDLAPTMSPVRWLQQIGRIMRPGGESEYVCANRNLLRHGYLLEGLVPSEAFAQATSAFPTPSRRAGVRAFGLEGLGRLKPCAVPLANGGQAAAYYVSRGDGRGWDQYAAIVLSNSPEVLWAVRRNEPQDGVFNWGKWARCPPPEDLMGFASVPARPLSPAQLEWWRGEGRYQRCGAEKHGLDPNADVDSKTFQVLPVLSHLNMRVI